MRPADGDPRQLLHVPGVDECMLDTALKRFGCLHGGRTFGREHRSAALPSCFHVCVSGGEGELGSVVKVLGSHY